MQIAFLLFYRFVIDLMYLFFTGKTVSKELTFLARGYESGRLLTFLLPSGCMDSDTTLHLLLLVLG